MHTRHERFDSVIIGSSQAGDKLAIDLARAGLRVALVYGHAQQGDACVDSGCGPSRPLLASANVARVARTAADFGVETGDVAVNFGKVQLRKQAVVDRLRSKAMQVLSNTPRLTVIRGDPEFESARVVRVQELAGDAVLELQSPRIIVNTGARPALPGLPGLAAVPYLTSSSATDVDELPQHLLVLGAVISALNSPRCFDVSDPAFRSSRDKASCWRARIGISPRRSRKRCGKTASRFFSKPKRSASSTIRKAG